MQIEHESSFSRSRRPAGETSLVVAAVLVDIRAVAGEVLEDEEEAQRCDFRYAVNALLV